MKLFPKIVQGLILAISWFGGPYAAAQQEGVIAYTLDDYFQYTGRENYFTGRLLTSDNLSNEQQFERQKDRFLPEVDAALGEIFAPSGLKSVTLFFYEEDVVFGHAMDPTNSDRPHADDFVLLNDFSGTWRGQVYLPAYAGVYDLEGTFANPVAEPAAATLSLLAFLTAFARCRSSAAFREHSSC